MRKIISDDRIDYILTRTIKDIFSELIDESICRLNTDLIIIVEYHKVKGDKKQGIIIPNIDVIKECAFTLDYNSDTPLVNRYLDIVYRYNTNILSELQISKSYFVKATFAELCSKAKFKSLSQKDVNRLLVRVTASIDNKLEELTDTFSYYLIYFLQVVVDKINSFSNEIDKNSLEYALNGFKEMTLDIMFG